MNCVIKIEHVMGKCPKTQLIITFLIKMIQSIFFTGQERPFCQTEIHLGLPYLCCSLMPMPTFQPLCQLNQQERLSPQFVVTG